MALATQCPHCKTTFKVAHDQLKLRAGLVRCGACKQIFNGIENLLRPDEVERTVAVPVPPPAPAPTPAADSVLAANPAPDTAEPDATDVSASPLPSLAEPDNEPSADTTPTPVDHPPDDQANEAAESFGPPKPDKEGPFGPVGLLKPASDSAETDPLQRMTLMDFTYPEDRPVEDGVVALKQKTAEPADTPDPLEEAIEALQRKPLRGSRKGLLRKGRERKRSFEPEEPSFIKQSRRRQRLGRKMRMLLAAGSSVLLVTLLTQSAYVFRDEIAARLPAAKPALAGVCSMFGCKLSPPAQIDAVSLESSELQALAPDKNIFGLTVLLRNRSATAQAWPNIELTLNDANEKAIARRVFTPREYLTSTPDLSEFSPKSEQSVKLSFELSQLKASGYRVYLFYP